MLFKPLDDPNQKKKEQCHFLMRNSINYDLLGDLIFLHRWLKIHKYFDDLYDLLIYMFRKKTPYSPTVLNLIHRLLKWCNC